MGPDRDRAELSSAETTLDELITRITAIAERRQEQRDTAVAADLFEVERSLRVASRRLTAVRRRLG
jgi:hypothetical protein